MEIESVLDAMRKHAPELAKAKADRVYLEQFRKSKKAILFQSAPDGPIADREAYAYAHPDYVALLEGLREAVEREEELKWRMITAQHRVDIWRTKAADRRKEQINYGA